MKIKKAIIPAGGLATRFLPASKAIPKEMFPIVDKPILQYLIEELSSAGIEEVLIVIGRGKEAIPRHFDKAPELYDNLTKNNKTEFLALADSPCHLAKITYLYAYEPNGVANVVMSAKSFVNNEPFVMVFGDELILNPEISATQQMIELFNKTNLSVIGCKAVPGSETHKYGIMKLEKKHGIDYVVDMVEKPKSNPPSNLSAVGKYLLMPEIFDVIESVLENNKNKETSFTESLRELGQHGKLVSCDISGKRFDTGSKLGFIVANIEYALSNPEIGNELNEYLKNKYVK